MNKESRRDEVTGGRFRYFEDYQVGQKGITNTRTVTEADIVNFACLVADYADMHVDRHYAADSIHGERVAHGLLASSLVTGLLSWSAPHILGRGVPGAYLYGFGTDYRQAVKLGDTINVQWHVAEKANDTTHEGFGLVKTNFQVVNQEGISACNGTLTTLVRKESSEHAELQLKPGDPWQIEEFIPELEQVYCIEDLPVGKGGETDGRTITETDILSFAGLTGDYNPQYVDAEFAKRNMFGERIAHGMMICVVGTGLWVRGWDRHRPHPKPGIAGHLSDRATFLFPVKIGDTIRCRYKIMDARVSKSRPEAGLDIHGVDF